jgi:hypothetical protein
MEWVPGERVREATPELAATVARYLCFLKEEFSGGEGAPVELLAEMIRVNTGRDWEGPLPEEPRCGIDGRLMPHEWIRTAQGFIKTDALDHHDDHFLPGCQSIAWDVAGAAVELGIDLGRPAAFYTCAYRAFRKGYATLAQKAITGTADAERFRLDAGRF